jgi:hypothetical protein
MARPFFKRAFRSFLPETVERSTYVLATSLLLMLFFLGWTPLPLVVWNAGVNPLGFALEMLSYVGWALVVVGTFQFEHLEFLGLRQVLCHLRGEELPLARFDVPFLYRWVRHPIHAGFLLAFWSTSWMTVGHLLFAVCTTAYVLCAVRLEERDLASEHGTTGPTRRACRCCWPSRRPLRLAQRRPAQAPPVRRSRAS